MHDPENSPENVNIRKRPFFLRAFLKRSTSMYSAVVNVAMDGGLEYPSTRVPNEGCP